jgi:hypothetical protein
MMTLSPELTQHVDAGRLANLFALRTRRAAQLAEAEKVAELAALAAWRPEALALVTTLTASLAADDKRIAVFESCLPALETKARAELVARATLGNIQRSHVFGSTDRKTALKLRDDLEAAESNFKVCARELLEAKSAACSWLPSTSTISDGPGREIVEALANHVIAKRFHPEYAVDLDIRKRWLAMTEIEAMWVSVHAARALASARPEWQDNRREAVALPKKEFLEEFAALKVAREVHHAAKVRAAQSIVDSAKASAAALETGGAA